jgi:hypothetical protein
MFPHQSIQALVVLPDCGIVCDADLSRAARAKVVRPSGITEVPSFDVENLRKRQSGAHRLTKVRT